MSRARRRPTTEHQTAQPVKRQKTIIGAHPARVGAAVYVRLNLPGVFCFSHAAAPHKKLVNTRARRSQSAAIKMHAPHSRLMNKPVPPTRVGLFVARVIEMDATVFNFLLPA